MANKFKILVKKGTQNYKEKKLLNDLQPILERKMLTDSNFATNFKPVNNYEDLKKLHDIYCTENAEIISETPNITNMENKKSVLSNEKDNDFDKKSNFTESTKNEFSDPFNEEQPIIRDYVLNGDEYTKTPLNQQQNVGDNFNEPLTFDDAFSIPTDDDGNNNNNNKTINSPNGSNNSTNSTSGNNSNQSNQKQNSTTKTPPVNPYFDDQSNALKKKQTKRFAKYITAFVCFALEKGYVWYATKNINEAKMIEYELKNEIDTSLIVTLDGEQQITAKKFFQRMCNEAKIAAKIPQDDQDELADALCDVLLEKGIAPTSSQNLIMVGVQILAKQGTNLFMSVSITNSVITGLKDHKKQQVEDENAAMDDLYNEANKSESVTDKKETKEVETETVDYTEVEEG
jgi:hypothetical protein